MDLNGNVLAQEGVDTCFCGSTAWVRDQCLDCNTHVLDVQREAVSA